MARPSRKKRQDEVYGVVAGVILLVGLGIMFTFELTNIYYIGGLILFAVVMGSVASSFVPDMRKRENKNKNPYTGLHEKTRRRK